MSELKILGQKIDSVAASATRSETLYQGLLEQMTTFVAFSARAEERHIRLEKVETRVDKLWDMVHKNSLIVNGVVFVVTAILIWYVKGLIDGN